MTGQTRSVIIDDMAAVSEQFRKTAEAATEQGRQTVSAAQDQLQQNLAKVQQVQGDVARMMVRWNEQNCQLMTAALTGFWDASMSALKAATWGQDRSEQAVLQAMEQGRTTREEGATFLRDAYEQARRYQTEMCRLAHETMRVGIFYAGKTPRREGETAR